MKLVCDTCGRVVSSPYDIGDMCFELCGGYFIELEEDDRDENQDAHADWLIDPDMGDQ
jgi:hypothetical protein